MGSFLDALVAATNSRVAEQLAWHHGSKHGFCEYPAGGDLETGRYINGQLPAVIPRKGGPWIREPEGRLGEGLAYIVRASAANGASRQGYTFPKQGYCAPANGEAPGAGLYGFNAAIGFWEMPILGMGYGRSFQVLTVSKGELLVASDGQECVVPRAWVKHSGSLSEVLAAVAREGDYGAAVAANLRHGVERVLSTARWVASPKVANPAQLASHLATELAASR